MSHRRACGVGLVSIFVIAVIAVRVVDAWRSSAMLDEARTAMKRGDYRGAAGRLARLADRRPGDGEAALLLGDCEDALGRPVAAIEAWGRVPEAASRFADASLRRGRRASEVGRFAVAETALTAAIARPGPQAGEASGLLLRLLWREARFAEVAAMIESQWAELARDGQLTVPAALDLLRGHLSLDFETFPVDEIEARLRLTAEQSPDDDAVGLALARWAIRTGRLDEAGVRLAEIARRRPDDPAGWLVRLDWAVASGRVDVARETIARIPAARIDEADQAALRAWLAQRRGDAVAEHAALKRRIELQPGDLAAIGRLAELALTTGQTERAAQLRRRKAELDAAKQRYQSLFKDDALDAQSSEMARLAGDLGRRFEAAAFAALAGRNPRNPIIRNLAGVVPKSSTVTPVGGPSLADQLVELPDARPLLGIVPHVAPSRKPSFTDDAETAGLRFVFDSGATPNRQLPETMSGGVGLLDFDGDGRLDVYAVQGGVFPPSPGLKNGDRLFRNRGDGRFDDVSESSGIAAFPGGYGHGVTVGDVDNDGRPDLFVTRWRSYALYRNRGDGTFEDLTAKAGLDGDRDWPTSAAFADLDNDGDLDLYVCHYLTWDAEHPRICPDRNGRGNRSCDPRHFAALPDHIFRNDGGRFVDVTATSGVVDRNGRGLGVVAVDVDDDGLVDLFVANDGSANYLLRNLGGLRFEEVGLASGVANNVDGAFQAGMGTAAGDLDGDGLPDLLVTNFYGESTTYFRNLGRGMFADRTSAIGLAAPSRFRLGFGIALVDVNNDGWPDIATANGHVNDGRPEFPYAMPAQLLLGNSDGRLIDATRDAGPAFLAPRIGRGLATGDFDDDGRVDLILVGLDGPMAMLRNRTDPPGHFVSFTLEGATSNRDAVGAVITATLGDRRLRAWRTGGGSYLSASDPRVHFGLDEATRVDCVEVKWPSGKVDRIESLEANRAYRLREGDTKATIARSTKIGP